MKDPIGILIYGYNQDDTQKIQSAIDGTVDNPLFVISASGKESWLVADILDKGPEEVFEDKEAKIIMFIGFSEGQVSAALRNFPSPEVTRPIFCGLTVKNIQWTIKYLIEHLQEEHRQFTGQPQPTGEA
jgi:hypothetical protein